MLSPSAGVACAERKERVLKATEEIFNEYDTLLGELAK